MIIFCNQFGFKSNGLQKEQMAKKFNRLETISVTISGILTVLKNNWLKIAEEKCIINQMKV